MMIPTEARVRPVNVFVNSVVLVVFPEVPRSIELATVCKFAAMISEIKTVMMRAVIAITSPILKSFHSPNFDCSAFRRENI